MRHRAGSSKTASLPSRRRRSNKRTATTTSSLIDTAELASWLLCPTCFRRTEHEQPLASLGGSVLGCEHGHRFDAHRRGYFNALDPAAGITGDSREILKARSAFLGHGHYRPIMNAVAASIPQSPSLDVVDAGSGTGHYLAHVLAAAPARRGLALDASSSAVAMSVATARSPGLVADTWKPLPVREDSADVILCVFAPRNAAEFARILRSEGSLVVVTPGAEHLGELRAAGLMIGMQEAKREALGRSLRPHFDLAGASRVRFEMDLDAAAGDTLASMGPSGHHKLTGRWGGGAVTVDVEVTVWQPTRR